MSRLPQTSLAQHPLLFCAAALCVGIAVANYLPRGGQSTVTAILIIGIGLMLLAAWAAARGQLFLASATVIVTFALAGFALLRIGEGRLDQNRIKQLIDTKILAEKEPVELTGVVQGPLQSTPDSLYLTLGAEALRWQNVERPASGIVQLVAHTSRPQLTSEYVKLNLRHGARIRVMTVLERDEDYRNPGGLPFTEYLDRKGYDADAVIKSPLLVERLEDEPVFLPLAWLYEWREHLEQEFARDFSPETAGVLDAALLGNQYNVSREAGERFRAGGTFHVLVISGLQIAFIGGLALVVARWFTKRKLFQILSANLFLWAYTIAVGADASVTRSALMFTTLTLAAGAGRRANTLNSLGGAAIALLIWQPGDLFDPSFQLTFLSVLSLVTIAVPLLAKMQQVGSWRPTHETPYPPEAAGWFRTISEILFWSERKWKSELAASHIRYKLFKPRAAVLLERWRVQGALRFSLAAVAVSASVQLGMLPLLIIYFHRVSLSALLLNIFVGMAMAAVALSALAGIVIAQISSTAAVPLFWLTEKIDWLMIHMVDPFSRAGVASFRLPHYHGWPSITYFLYWVFLTLLIVVLARWNPLRPTRAGKQASPVLRPSRVVFAGACFVSLLVLIVMHPFAVAPPDGQLHVDFLDVGQGDCVLVTMPDGATLMIDGGGRPNIDWNKSDDADEDTTFQRDTRSIGEGVVSEYLWSRGVDQIDYILPTHADADHIDGLNDVAHNFMVRGAIVARTPADDDEFSRFAQSTSSTRIPVERVAAGDVLRFAQVSLDVLWPPPANDVGAPDRNNDSVVLRLRYGEKTILFMGDVEKQAEAQLATAGIDLAADVVKVAHHGSRTSSSQAFVAAAHPSLAIISVGRTSIFGHPNREVIDRWRTIGAQVMTTGEKGMISVVTDGKNLKIGTFVN